MSDDLILNRFADRACKLPSSAVVALGFSACCIHVDGDVDVATATATASFNTKPTITATAQGDDCLWSSFPHEARSFGKGEQGWLVNDAAAGKRLNAVLSKDAAIGKGYAEDPTNAFQQRRNDGLSDRDSSNVLDNAVR